MELAVDTSSQTMELLCAESGESQRAFQDPVFLKDNRVIHNLMKLEGHYTIPSDYMAGQTDIKVFMRKIITQWMCEVRCLSCTGFIYQLRIHGQTEQQRVCLAYSRRQIHRVL